MPLPFRYFVRALEMYVPGEQPTDPSIIKLNTNENPYPPAPSVIEALRSLGEDLVRKYPPATADALRDSIAGRLGVRRDEVIVGYGSDEALRLLCHAFAGPGQPIACLNPTYSLFPILAAMFQAATLQIDERPPASPAEDAHLPEALVHAPAALVMLPNPNPPYGTFYPLSEIERLCRANPDRVVVSDEAYADFAPASAVTLLGRHPNLVVTRSFSKSYSLAGMRVGFAVARAEIIDRLLALKDSYNLPIASQRAALAAWEAHDHFEQARRRILMTRAALAEGLVRRGFRVHVSHGNFVFARRDGARQIYESLKARGVLVRHWDKTPIHDGIRVTVGTDAEVARLFAELDRLGLKA